MRVEPPVRVRHAYRQRIEAPPSAVFPLLCPVREREWIPEWEPALVLTRSGVAEGDAVFVTEVEGREAIWVVTEHDPDAGAVAMVEVVPGLVVIRLGIRLEPLDHGRATACDVTYTYTALSEAGEAFVADRTAAWFDGFMRTWEALLNRYLAGRPKMARPA